MEVLFKTSLGLHCDLTDSEVVDLKETNHDFFFAFLDSY